jgi:hypothetical protein
MDRKTIAIDFDGVIHSYTSGWKGADTIPDPPTPGAIEWLAEAHSRFEVAIYSTRAETAEGRRAIAAWLRKNGLHEIILAQIKITSAKPMALIYLDDRGWQFTGTFPSLDEIEAFKPWNKR